MCGILFHIGNEEIHAEHPALNIITHRGPDAAGANSFIINDTLKLGMGHRRLAIIDLSEKGRQPMSYGNSLHIIFNGEIYNYIELREELISAGYTFATDCDTEVLLAAYSKWGNRCMEKLNGMFSFIIFDKKKNKVLIVRDRFGIKPLYYYNSADGFWVVSEIKQLTQCKNFSAHINSKKLFHFLLSGDFSFDKETLWEGVFELEPGCMIELNLNVWQPGSQITQIAWYKPDFISVRPICYKNAVEEFKYKLTNAVKLRLRADVPIGFLLSGGIDSSALTGISINLLRENGEILKTFSSCFEEGSIDEREYINAMLAFSNASASLHFPKPNDLVTHLDKVIWYNDIPIRPGSPLPHWLLYKHIKEDNDSRKVIIEGQGSDEILCGYRDFLWANLFELLRLRSLPKFFTELKNIQKHHNYPVKVILRKFKTLLFPSLDNDAAPNPAINLEFFLKENDNIKIAIKRQQPSVKEMHKARFVILRYILHNVDRNSMAHSCETRVPFLDHNLVEFCLSLPPEFKVADGTTKKILRDSIKGFVPEKIRIRQSKQGYSSPVPIWLKKELREFFLDSISEIDFPFIRKDILNKDISSFIKGEKQFEQFWWWLVTTWRWTKIFNLSQ